QSRRCTQARRHSASDVDRWNRVQLVQEGGWARYLGEVTRTSSATTPTDGRAHENGDVRWCGGSAGRARRSTVDPASGTAEQKIQRLGCWMRAPALPPDLFLLRHFDSTPREC